jgi:uncharacterized protein
MRRLIVIATALLLAWAVGSIVLTRLQWLNGTTVVATVTGKHRVLDTHRFHRSHDAIFPVVSYRLPSDWPVNPGLNNTYVLDSVESTSKYPLGADVQLKLNRLEPLKATEYSLSAIWTIPWMVMAFGTAALLVVVFVVAPAPSRPQPGLRPSRQKGKHAPDSAALIPRLQRTRRFGLLVVIAALLLVPAAPLLGVALLFLPITVWIVVASLLALLRRLAAPVMSAARSATDRPGPDGLLVDLIQWSALALIGATFFLEWCVLVPVVVKTLAPDIEWSSTTLNTARTLMWLPQDFDSALCATTRRADVVAARWLAHHGAREETVCAGGDPPLTAALLLWNDPDVMPNNARIADRVLLAAIGAGDHDTVESLLKQGANPDQSIDGVPLLVRAAFNGDGQLMAQLLAAGADPNAALDRGGTVLTETATVDQWDLALVYLRQLQKAGGNLDALNADGRTLLLQHSMSSGQLDMHAIDQLLEMGANPNVPDHAGLTALDHLRARDALEAAEHLVANGGRSGRVQQGGDAVPINRSSSVARYVAAQLERMATHTTSEWQPDIEKIQLSEYEARELKLDLPRSNLRTRGWMAARRASVTVCGMNANATPVCLGMELRYQSPEASPNFNAGSAQTTAPENWSMISVWKDYAASRDRRSETSMGHREPDRTGASTIRSLHCLTNRQFPEECQNR